MTQPQEVLRVTEDGKFIWHEDADRMIVEGDFSHAPAMQHMLKALRKQRQWVGLTDEEISNLWSWSMTLEAELTATTQQHAFAQAIEAKLKEKNT